MCKIYYNYSVFELLRLVRRRGDQMAKDGKLDVLSKDNRSLLWKIIRIY